MKKKIGIWLAACLLLLASSVPVFAARNENAIAQAISGYCLGDELYAFVRLNDGYDIDSFKVGLMSDAVTSNEEAAITPVTETSSIVRYVFMIDLTGSMRKYTEQVNAFLDALTAAEKQEAFYTIATFGERFNVISENLTDKNAVKDVLQNLEYTEQLTDPYTGVKSAITYLDSYSRRSGDIINLIVITDGDPDLGYDDEEEAARTEKELAASLTEKIVNTPEVIISTLCTAEWDETAYAALSNGNGIHELISDDQDAETAGTKMANYVDSLYRTSFKLSREPDVERFSIGLKMRGTDLQGTIAMLDIDIGNIPNLKLFSNTVQTEQPGDIGAEDVIGIPGIGDGAGADTETAGDTETVGDKETAGDTENAGDTETAGDTESAKDTENAEDTESAKDTENAEDAEDTEDAKTAGNGVKGFLSNMNPVLLVLPVVCVVIVAVICFVILLKKKKEVVAEDGGAAAMGGIPMRLEVYEGNCTTEASILYLAGELFIGSGPGCNLTFADAGVAPHHAKIVMRNNMIYIEDLNSPTGTYLGGMRIQGQNRLRSGDIISVGNSEFSLKF